MTAHETEQHRKECEARHVLSLPTRIDRQAYLERIGIKRGQLAKQEVLKQWKK